jgi:vitamin K-dependent gamma-carboxylase
MSPTATRSGRLLAFLDEAIDGASLLCFRVLFGLTMVVAVARFFTHGWIAADYQIPTHFFPYWGFSWVRPWPGQGMVYHYASMGLCALGMALGLGGRLVPGLFALLFGYAHFCDKSNYLNHYVLVTLVATLVAILPLSEGLSPTTLRSPQPPFVARRWMLWLLRFAFATVYVFGGLGKLGADWLFAGQPLRIWLSANAGLPVLGRWLVHPLAPLVFSWCGLLFDLSIVPLMLWRKSRSAAFAVAVVFHVLTSLLFRIGLFPWIMLGGLTLFFEPSWPRRCLGRLGAFFPPAATADEAGSRHRLPPFALVPLGLFVLVSLTFPLRSLLYPGNTLWTEEGFRFSWKVMLIEKSGELEYLVVDEAGRRTYVSPRDYLTPFQARMAATQPDMILELSHIVARDFEARGRGRVQVYADAWVSFNGRRRARLIRADVDLAREEDGLGPKAWIVPSPDELPGYSTR